MKINLIQRLLYVALFILYLLHNDLWFWNDGTLVLGLPVGLFYHFGFCMVTAVVLFLLVRFAWPAHLDSVSEKESGV
jgi:hypothetical protein